MKDAGVILEEHGTVGPHAATKRREARRIPILLLLPSLFIAAVMLLPVTYLIMRAVEGGPNIWPSVLRIRTLELLVNSIGLAAAVTLSTVLLAVPLAWLTTRSDIPGKRVWATLAGLPLVIPSYVGAFAFISALGPRGLLQQGMEVLFGVNRLPSIYGFFGAWFVLTLFTYPYVFLTTKAAIHGLDPSLEEVSRSLRKGGLYTFWHVTLPQLRPSIGAGGLLTAFYTLSDFGLVSLLQFDTLTRAIYLQYQTSFDRSVAAVFALILVNLTALVLLAESVTRGRSRYYRSSARPARSIRVSSLGIWTAPALIFVSFVVFLALILPIGVLLYWLAHRLLEGGADISFWANIATSLIMNSLSAAGITAAITIVAATPIAFLSVRYRSGLARVIEGCTYIGYALPGTVIALALVFFAARVATPLYQTFGLLILAYTLRFLPQAVGGIRSSLLQVNPHLEEAARGLGRSMSQTLTAITLPLAWPGMLAGAALVFLTTMKELPATILLSPIGFRTLATAVWTGASEGFFADASIPALILIVISAIPLIIMADERRAEFGS